MRLWSNLFKKKIIKLYNLKPNSIIYTSGVGNLFKAGIPIGRINQEELNEINSQKKLEEKKVEFFSDFSQLRFVKVFAFIKDEVEWQN